MGKLLMLVEDEETTESYIKLRLWTAMLRGTFRKQRRWSGLCKSMPRSRPLGSPNRLESRVSNIGHLGAFLHCLQIHVRTQGAERGRRHAADNVACECQTSIRSQNCPDAPR